MPQDSSVFDLPAPKDPQMRAAFGTALQESRKGKVRPYPGAGALDYLRTLMGGLERGASATKGAVGTSLADLLEYLQIGMPEHGRRPAGVAVGSAMGQAAGGVADVGGDLLKGFKDIMAGVQEGYGGVEAPKPPVLSGPTERAVLSGPRVSEAAPRKVPGITGLSQQPVQAPTYPQVPTQQLPASGLNLGSPESFQGIGAASLGLPTVQQPGRGARGLQALKEIFGPGGAVDWEFNIPDTGITFAPGQTRRQRAGALAGQEAKADIAATQAGTLKDLSQAGVYELESDPDFQKLKLMAPQLAAQLLEEGRNRRFDIGQQTQRESGYLRERGLYGRQQIGLESKEGLAQQAQTFEGLTRGVPTGGETGRLQQSALFQYFKIRMEGGPEEASLFWRVNFPGQPEPQLPQQESSSWWPF